MTVKSILLFFPHLSHSSLSIALPCVIFGAKEKIVFNLHSLSHCLHLVGTKFRLRKKSIILFSLYPDLSVFISLYFSLSLSLSLVNPIVTSLSVTSSLITETVGKRMKQKSGFLSGQTTLSEKEEK